MTQWSISGVTREDTGWDRMRTYVSKDMRILQGKKSDCLELGTGCRKDPASSSRHVWYLSMREEIKISPSLKESRIQVKLQQKSEGNVQCRG